MTTAVFSSILSPGPEVGVVANDDTLGKSALHDLQLEDVITVITAGRELYDLAPFYRAHAVDLAVVRYRQEVMRALERPVPRQAVDTFAERMRTMRLYVGMTTGREHELVRQRWHLAAAEAYVEAVQGLHDGLAHDDLEARGLLGLRAWLTGYVDSNDFQALAAEVRSLANALAGLRYGLVVRGNVVEVCRYDDDADLGALVDEIVAPFGRTSDRAPTPRNRQTWGADRVEEQVLQRVALLFPDVFGALARFRQMRADLVAPMIARFDREVQFYTGYLDFIARFLKAGLPICYPEVSACSKEVAAWGAFDVALATKLLAHGQPVVTNDFQLEGLERIFVVTGPNQGGKTTFARLFGQLHHLGALGCPVPGSTVRLYLYDRLMTHFEREEAIATLHGKLEDDLLRIHEVLERATPRSIVILNEIFSSTTVEDALFLGREVLTRLVTLDVLGVCVTFLDELSALAPQTVSLVGLTDPADPAVRTYKLERRPADGLAHALAIAEKHHVTYRDLSKRLAP